MHLCPFMPFFSPLCLHAFFSPLCTFDLHAFFSPVCTFDLHAFLLPLCTFAFSCLFSHYYVPLTFHAFFPTTVRVCRLFISHHYKSTPEKSHLGRHCHTRFSISHLYKLITTNYPSTNNLPLQNTHLVTGETDTAILNCPPLTSLQKTCISTAEMHNSVPISISTCIYLSHNTILLWTSYRLHHINFDQPLYFVHVELAPSIVQKHWAIDGYTPCTMCHRL